MTEVIAVGVFYAGFLASKEGWNGEYAGDGHETSFEQLKENILLSANHGPIPEVVELARQVYREMVEEGMI